MSDVVDSGGRVQCLRVVIAVAKALVDAKSGEQRARAIVALFVAVESLRKAGG